MRYLFFWIVCFSISMLNINGSLEVIANTRDDPMLVEASLAKAQEAVRQGRAFSEKGQNFESLEQFKLALSLFRETGNLQGEADVTSDIAVVYRKLGDFETSLALQQQAARIYADLGDTRGQAKALRRIGVLYRHKGNLFQAIAFQEQSLNLMKAAHDQRGIATILTNLGIVYGDLGRLQEAQSYFEQALQIYTQLQNPEGMSYTLGNLGQLFLYLGDSQQALQDLERSLEIKQTLGDIRGQANTLLNIGSAYKNLGDFQKSLTFYYKALEMYKQLNEPHGEAVTLGNIGLTYEKLGDLDRALQFQLQSLDFKKQSGTPLQLTVALTNLASLAIKQQRFAEANTYLQEGLGIAVEHESRLAQANIYGQFGSLALNQNMIDEALKYFTRSLELYQEIGSQKGLLEVFEYIGQVYLKQDLVTEALPYYERALHLAQELNDMNAIWTIQYHLGQIHLGKGDDEQALDCFKVSVDTLERMRSYLNVPELRQVFMRKQLNPYPQIIRLLLHKDRIEEALLYLERFKARTFLELVAHGEPQLHTIPTLLQEEQYVSARIRYLSDKLVYWPDHRTPDLREPSATEPEEEGDLSDYIQQELHHAKEQYEQLLLQIKLQYPEYYRLKTVDASEIQQLLDQAMTLIEEDVAILEYFLDDDAIHIWVIEHEQMNHISVPIPYKEVIKKVLTFRSEISWYESDDIYPLLQELYTWFIAPIEPYLVDKTTVGIVPFQILHFIPFSALISAPPNSSRKEGELSLQMSVQGKDEIPNYLIETYAMFSLPSLSMLPVVRDRSLQNTENTRGRRLRYYFLGIGNATDDLPGANEEVQTITNHFPDSKGYTGSEATKQRLLEEAGNYDIVHLATHGVYDKQHPMFSYLEFSPDSHLYAREIFGLPLEANLVTLSGCETLLPQQVDAEDIHTLVSGDELVGFIQAFMYAGTPSMLSSLWRVSDTATQYLMSAFYQNLSRIGKVKALQQACQSVIRSTIRIGRRKKRDMGLIHPFFWSSFVLIGDWK